MDIETTMGNQLARYMDMATDLTKVTAANMANIDTPGYTTLGLDFESEMRQALGDVVLGKSARHPQLNRVVDGLIARPDGNNVSMDRESLKMAEAQLKFKTAVSLLRIENQRITDAIHADK
jgi:flagellar basal-body rod protein FlgB